MTVAMSACALILLLGTAFGQSVEISNDPKYPLQIATVSPQIGPGSSLNGVKIVFRNAVQAPIVALSASVLVRLSNSSTKRITLSEDHAGSSRPTPLGPGQFYERTSQSRIVPRQGVTITGVEARVDYIEMADGTTYGPDPDNVQQQFRTNRFVKRTEREKLLQLYQERGLNALLDELKRR